MCSVGSCDCAHKKTFNTKRHRRNDTIKVFITFTHKDTHTHTASHIKHTSVILFPLRTRQCAKMCTHARTDITSRPKPDRRIAPRRWHTQHIHTYRQEVHTGLCVRARALPPKCANSCVSSRAISRARARFLHKYAQARRLISQPAYM